MEAPIIMKNFFLYLIVLAIFSFTAGFFWLAQLRLGLWLLGF